MPVRLVAFVLLALSLPLTLALNAGPLASAAGPEDPPILGRPADTLSGAPSAVSGYAYTVKAGDDVWIIAVVHGITMEELVAENDLQSPYWIYPGDKLWIPAEPAEVPERPLVVQPQPAAASASAGAGAAPSVVGPPADASEWGPYIVALMNEQRVARGLPALTWSSKLALAAQAHAEDMARRGWGSHVGSDGARLRTRVARAGYDASWAGENWANARSALQAFEMWWYEPPGADPHRRNILGSGYSEVGLGITRGGWGYYFVADFGSQ